jgi:hypothetical protein
MKTKRKSQMKAEENKPLNKRIRIRIKVYFSLETSANKNKMENIDIL